MQDIDLEYYKEHLAELLERCPDRWVAIHNGRLLGDWETLGEAYDEGIGLANSEDLMVQQVGAKAEVIIIPTLVVREVEGVST